MYDKLIDQETWDFIKNVEEFYPANATKFNLDQQRSCYNDLCRMFARPYPKNVTSMDKVIEGDGLSVPVRTYSNSNGNEDAHVMYIHGGGFVLGGLESHDDACANICDRTGFGVTAIDYRLSPEHPFPADFEDCFAVYHHLAEMYGDKIIISGDSAGGTLTASLCQSLRSHPKPPIGQVLIYPSLGMDLSKGSFVEFADAPLLTTADMIAYRDYRIGDELHHLNDPRCVPLADDDFSNLPPTFIVTAQCDPLASDGETYRDRLLAAGSKAEWVNEDGLVHGYLRAIHTVERARESFERITTAMADMAERAGRD